MQRPPWGLETSSDEAFSCLPTRLPIPGWVQPGVGQCRAGRPWGDWLRRLAPRPKCVIHSQRGLGSGMAEPQPLTPLGTCALSGPDSEISLFSFTEEPKLFCFLRSNKYLFSVPLLCLPGRGHLTQRSAPSPPGVAHWKGDIRHLQARERWLEGRGGDVELGVGSGDAASPALPVWLRTDHGESGIRLLRPTLASHVIFRKLLDVNVPPFLLL